MYDSFLSYQNYRYLKLAVALSGVSVVIYARHFPIEPANGGTWLGYTLGTIGALLIVLLLWLGVRKRQYHQTAGQFTSWVSAHVYLGCALIVVATLHCGFQFGWNIHTLTYVLMMLVIVSGIFGVLTYALCPSLLTQVSTASSGGGALAEIARIDTACLSFAEPLSHGIHEAVLISIEGTSIQGSLWQQLTGRTGLERKETRQWLARFHERQDHQPATPLAANTQHATLLDVVRDFCIDALAGLGDPVQVERGQRLVEHLTRKKDYVNRMRRELQYRALMRCWLYLHVPLAIALLAALIVHIIVVFFYW